MSQQYPVVLQSAGLRQGSKQEPSFARGPAGCGSRGHQGGDFIVRGADGRGGRATVLRPTNRQTSTVQVCPPCVSLEALLRGCAAALFMPEKQRTAAVLHAHGLPAVALLLAFLTWYCSCCLMALLALVVHELLHLPQHCRWLSQPVVHMPTAHMQPC